MVADRPSVRVPAARAPATIRPYRPADREAVREICRMTAFRNLGAAAAFEDGESFADYWTRYYTDFEPQSAWVAEQDGRVIGYVLGCLDTRRQIRVMARRIVPPVLTRVLRRWVTGRYRQPVSHRFLRWLVLKSWREAPHIPLERFPAHYHCNILPDGYQQHLYSRLALTFVADAARRGCPGVHGSIIDARTKGVWQRMLQRVARDHPERWFFQAERPTDLYRDVLGDDEPMVNRAYGTSTENYLWFLGWIAQTYRL
jgi:hypothetical protein